MTGRIFDTFSYLRTIKASSPHMGSSKGHRKTMNRQGKFVNLACSDRARQAGQMSSTPSVPLSPRVRLILLGG